MLKIIGNTEDIVKVVTPPHPPPPLKKKKKIVQVFKDDPALSRMQEHSFILLILLD